MLVFSLTFGLVSFAASTNPWAVWGVVGLLALLVLYLAYCTWDAYEKWKRGEGSYETFLILLLITLSMFGALCLAVACGIANRLANVDQTESLKKLNSYYSVDPSNGLVTGAQMMDAGRVKFAEGTHLNLKMANAFRDKTMYCVAPIVGPNPAPPGVLNYDFWAVGTDCCDSSNSTFQCGAYNDPTATGGLRVLNDKQRAFFRLAVQQAEAANNIMANHPLFFHWVKDPFLETNNMKANAMHFFWIGCGAFFVWQLFIVLVVGFYLVRHMNDEKERQSYQNV